MAQGGKKAGGSAGATFTSDFTSLGPGASRTGQQSSVLLGGNTNILQEEKRLIEKVFSIVDKDNSGSIDVEELKDMFKLFSVETEFLSTAINRIMSNVDKDHD